MGGRHPSLAWTDPPSFGMNFDPIWSPPPPQPDLAAKGAPGTASSFPLLPEMENSTKGSLEEKAFHPRPWFPCSIARAALGCMCF